MSNSLLVGIFHLAANIRYGSVGERTVESVFYKGFGSCSTKHEALATLCEQAGYEVRRYCVKVDLNCLAKYLPISLQAKEGLVFDYHNFLRVKVDGAWRLVDATFGAYEATLGLPTNIGWDGLSDCTLLFDGVVEEPVLVNEMFREKEILLRSFSKSSLFQRQAFFSGLTAYLKNAE